MTERGTLADVTHEVDRDPAEGAWFRRDEPTVTDGGNPRADAEDEPDATRERDASTERLAEVSHTNDDQPEVQGEIWKRGQDVPDDDE